MENQNVPLYRAAMSIGIVAILGLVVSMFFEDLWNQVKILALPVAVLFLGFMNMEKARLNLVEYLSRLEDNTIERLGDRIRTAMRDRLRTETEAAAA